MSDEDFDRAVRAHDQAVAALGLEIWAGTEPTFTDRFSDDAEWLTAALGDDKAQRAEALLQALHSRLGGLVLRTAGRQYPGEELPRWSLGLYGRRDGTPLWQGPADPAFTKEDGGEPNLVALQAALCEGLAAQGYATRAVTGQDRSLRVLACPARAASDCGKDAPGVQRPPLHSQPIAAEGLVDRLAEHGLWLFIIDPVDWHGRQVARVELPACDSPERYADWLQALGAAARSAGLSALLLTGYPPPVDASVSWTTITPDPAVIEINMAPYPDLSSLLAATRTLYAEAARLGLAPYRLYYNGTLADSGGGGQITLGGPRPEASAFFRVPQLLPRLVRYANHHPALSYLFAHDYVGGSGQAARTDERGRDALRELELALAQLERKSSPTPEDLWASLSPCLTDSCGNSHRAELNIEKLWNPYLPGRGKQGLVEFRALRMQHTAERASALAVLLRAIVAMLATRHFDSPLGETIEELHERFALPFYLERDLEAVLADLTDSGLGLDAPLVEMLQRDEFRHWASVQYAGCELRVRRAIEFWPLVGDASRPDQGASRLVDSSTTRIELSLRPIDASTEDFAAWQIAAANLRLPLRDERDARGPAKVFGVRYRSFVPWQGLHPALPAQGPLRLLLFRPGQDEALRLTLYEWRPDQGPYPGPPVDLDEARERRAARCLAETLPAPAAGALQTAPSQALTAYSLDLRWTMPEA